MKTTDATGFGKALERAATYLSVSHGAGLLSVTTILPDLLKDPKLALAVGPIVIGLGSGFLLALCAYYSALMSEVLRRNEQSRGTLAIVSFICVLFSAFAVVYVLTWLYDAVSNVASRQ